MGCASSKNKLTHVDDSVHRMLAHDRKVAKKKGEVTKGYVPRAAHPLLQSSQDEINNSTNIENPSVQQQQQQRSSRMVVATEEDDEPTNTTTPIQQ